MKTLAIIITLVSIHAALSAPEPYPVTINSRAQTAPPVVVYKGGEQVFRVTFKDGSAASDISGQTPFMSWATNASASVVSTSSVSVVGASTGVVDFTFSPAALNHDAGRYIYEAGVLTADGNARVYRQGVFQIFGSPYAGGADSITWVTNLNWGTIAWLNLPDYVESGGTISSATTVNGPQSNLIASALQSESDPVWVAVSNTVTTGAASGATATQPGDNVSTLANDAAYINALAATNAAAALDALLDYADVGALAVDGTAEGAYKIVGESGDDVWLTICSAGTVTVWQVSNTSNVYVTATSGDGYNGPDVGITWTDPEADLQGWQWSETTIEGTPTLLRAETNPDDLYAEHSWDLDWGFGGWRAEGFLSASFSPLSGDASGTLTIDWVTVTNSYPIAKQADLAAAIAALNLGTMAEADAGDYYTAAETDAKIGTAATAGTNYTDAATNALAATIPTLPSAGCTTLTGTTPEIDGSTLAYFYNSTTNYTLSVSGSASRIWHYSIDIRGTNAAALGANLEYGLAWTPAATNQLVIVPSTGTLWRVFGRGW